MKQTDDKKLHWYYFTFTDGKSTNCMCSGLSSKNITLEIINDNREFATKTKENAVLIGLFYLGEMTKTEFYTNQKNDDK